MTKLADIPPFCAACFQPGPEKRYIDFDAAYDGPVLTLEDGRKQPIDDLVLCEDCLQEAFDLLDPQGIKHRIAELEAIVAGLEKDIKAKDGIIQRFGVTAEELIRHPIKRQAAHVEVTGVPDDFKHYLNVRREERNRKSRQRAGK